MLTHLVVPLDAAAISFCYYDNERYASGPSEPIPESTLRAAVDYAQENGLAVSFIYGPDVPPDGYSEMIESVPHMKVVPPSLRSAYPDAMLVINPEDVAGGLSLPTDACGLNVVLRLGREHLPELASVVESLLGSCARINLILLDIDQYSDEDLSEYESQLGRLIPVFVGMHKDRRPVELSCLTDRIFLRQMRNCDAGIVSLTVGPDGNFHLCPGFISSSPLGSLASGISIPDSQLLEAGKSPICSICDAWHCKRCVWMSKNMTGEINIPSRQQCSIAHLEREASRQLVERLRRIDGMRHIPRIQWIDYLDPFELIQRDDGYHGADVASEDIVQNKASETPVQDVCAITDGETAIWFVTSGERDEIERLFEHRNSLAELALSLQGSADSSLGDKVTKELAEVEAVYHAWWQRKSEEYGWESRGGAEWRIDFQTCAIHLAEIQP
jgi:CXXX repeat modification system protein